MIRLRRRRRGGSWWQSTRSRHLIIRAALGASFATAWVSGARLASAVDQFFACNGTSFNAAKWASTSAGPFTSNFVTGNIANFAVVNGDGQGASITWGGAHATEDFTLASVSGTISNVSNSVVTIAVDAGKTLDFSTQAFTSSATAGYIKTGDGVLALAGNTYGGGFTLTAGTVVLRNANALGAGANGTLTINGGVIAVSAFRNLTGKFPGGIKINGDFTIGATTGLAAATSSITFGDSTTLGNATRTITIGGNGTYSLGGNISGGPGAGLIINATGTGSLGLGGSNTYDGGTTINGGTLAVSADSQLGNAAGSLVLNGGTLLGFGGSIRTVTVAAGNGAINIPANLALTVASIGGGATGGVLTKTNTGFLVATNGIDTGGLNVANGTVQISQGRSIAKTSIVRSTLTVASIGALDLNDNDLIWDYSGAQGTKLTDIRALTSKGYTGGTWLGKGITSARAADRAFFAPANPLAIGYAEASSVGITSFDGIAVDDTAIVLRYTLTGDANVDGVVNALDFNALASNFGASGSAAVWSAGDVNYDALVDSSDFTLLAKNFNASVPPLGGPTVLSGESLVPEPASLCALVALAALGHRPHWGRRRATNLCDFLINAA